MRARLFAAAKYVLYPTFYIFALFSCIYLTFPWDRLKERVENEFAKSQASKGSRAWRLEIASMDGYWLTGVELAGAKITMPPDDDELDTGPKTGTAARMTAGAAKTRSARPGMQDEASDDDSDSAKPGAKDAKGEEKEEVKKGPKESVILIDSAHARVRILPLLIGRVRLDFSASVFGGTVSGVVPIGGGDLEVALENLDLGQIAPLKDTVSVPLQGIANGKLELSAANGKWSKATGGFNLNVTGMIMGDGKEKFRGLATLPPANVGAFEMIAKADAGVLKIEKLGSTGGDLELVGEGTIKLKEPWDSSATDLWLRFGFSEEYKHKDERTEALFVDDGPFPALISQDRKMKRAKRTDGMWGFHIHGKLARLRYDPTTADGPKGKAPSAADAAKKKKAGDDDDDDELTSPPPSTPRKPPTFVKPGSIKPQPDPAAEVPTPDATPEPQEPEPAPEPDGVPPNEPPAPQEPPGEPQEEPAPAPQ